MPGDYLPYLLSVLRDFSATAPASAAVTTPRLASAPPPPTVPIYTGSSQNQITDEIHDHLQSLAHRLWASETVNAPSTTSATLTNMGNNGHASSSSSSSSITPSSVNPDGRRQLQVSPALQSLLHSVSNPQGRGELHKQAGGGAVSILTAGRNINSEAFESGLSAEEELRLLRAQVQDVARVCKVGFCSLSSRPAS